MYPAIGDIEMDKKNPTFIVAPSLNDFGIRPREGFKLCAGCRKTIPNAEFYKKDLLSAVVKCKSCTKKDKKRKNKATKLDRS